MTLRIRLAAALVLGGMGLGGPVESFEIPEGDTSKGARIEGAELGAPSAELTSPTAEAAPLGDAPDARIQRAWTASAASLEDRVAQTRREAIGSGIWSVDAAAIAALRSESGDPLERAKAAVALAPDLPAAHMSLASARWLQGDSPIAAAWSVLDALAAAVRHPEGSVWLLGSALFVVVLCLLVAGFVTLISCGFAALAHVAHDLGHFTAPAAPEFARVALLLGLLLCPLMLGEGFAGVALGAMAIAVFFGKARMRLVLAVAAGLVGVAAFPLADFAGRALSFFARDATAAAAYAVAGGSASPLDLARLRAHEDEDELALWALAVDARQRGRVGQADAYYQRLLETRGGDPVVANNAANVRLDLEHAESAFSLYEQALARSESAVVLFNLSQAYGRAFQVDDLNRALGQAQSLDGELVASLTSLEGSRTEGFVADLPLPNSVLLRRLWESDRGAALASELRAPLAPGRLGKEPRLFAAGFGFVWLFAALLGARFESAHGCQRCGARVCPRCDPSNIESELCTACTRLFFEPERTDRSLRMERMNALQRRQRRIDRIVTAVSVVVPGAAGLFAKRPLSLLSGACFAALAVAGLVWRNGVVPDPGVLGHAVPVVFLGMALVGLAGHATLVTRSLAARRKERT